MRLIDETGKNLGIGPTHQALAKAKAKGLDLIEITSSSTPPVCKIGDYGKYLYRLNKKEQKSSKGSQGGDLKEIQLTFKISGGDLETRKNRALKFLERGDTLRIRMRLRGRENALQDHAMKKARAFIELINEEIPVRVEKNFERKRGGLIAIITKE